MLRFSDNLIAQMTLGCNCNCKYCYEGKTHNNSKYIDFETFKGILDKYIYDRCVLGKIENYLNFHFHGGEVLTLPWEELKCMILYLEQRKKFFPNVCMSIQTNGTLIDDEKAKFFANHNIEVGISWDGYDSLRMESDKNLSLIENLRRLHNEYGVKFQFLLTLSKHNLKTWFDDFRSIQDISNGFGINTICTLSDNEDLAVTTDEQWEYWIKPVLESLLTDNPLNERAVKVMIEKLLATNILITSGLPRIKSGCFDRVCGFGVNMTSITPDLDMHNCDKFMEDGDFISKRQSYSLFKSDLWGLQQIKRLSHHYSEIIEYENKLGCNECPCSWICNGECQSYNISKYGHTKISPDICDLYNKFYDFFMKNWPVILEHSKYKLTGDIEGITPYAKDALKKSGYSIKIDLFNQEALVFTEKNKE